MGDWAYLDTEHPIAFAHRGGAGDHPENTMPAFSAAVELGYRYLETDVHVTRDGVLIAFHDDRLDRVTDRDGEIADLSWSEVRTARVGGREPILRLEELVDAFPDARFNIDAKHDACVDPLVEAIVRLGARDRVCVGSFSDARLARLRRLAGPGLCTSAGPREVLDLFVGRARPRRAGVACVQVPPSLGALSVIDPRFLRRCRRLGLPVHVWTIDDEAEMHRLLDLGVDGVMTDRPRVLREVLIGRGAWADAGSTPARGLSARSDNQG